MRKIVISIILALSVIVSSAGICLADGWPGGLLKTTDQYFIISKDSGYFGSQSWNYGVNLFVMSSGEAVGLVCLDYGFNYNTGNDYAYSYYLDLREKHISSIRQAGGTYDWLYANRGAEPWVYTYTTSLAAYPHCYGGRVDYGVDWLTAYSNMTYTTFQFYS